MSNETYRQSLIGRDGAIVIPTLFTGATFSASTTLTGLTSITNYLTFFDSPDLLQRFCRYSILFHPHSVGT